MQELRSTEILDNEIRAEARRKAENVLKRADEECAQILAGVDERIQNSCNEKHEFYAKKLAAFDKDIAASVPLEKQRMGVSFVQSELVKAVNKYLDSLGSQKRLKLVLQSCDPKVFEGREFDAFVYGFDVESAQKMLLSVLGVKSVSCNKTEFGKIIIEDDIGLEIKEGIILQTKDNAVRCRLTLSEVFNRVMDKYRAQLAQALFDGVKVPGGAQ